MKKLLTTIVAVALLATLSVPAFATVTNGTQNVNGTYVPGGTSAEVRSVDVSWGNMQFTYTAQSQGTWNPETHQYDNIVGAKWTNDSGANVVTVKNHSNTAITATATYSAKSGYESAIGTMSNQGKIQLATAVGTTVANAPQGTTELTFTGSLPQNTTGTIGTITVTIE